LKFKKVPISLVVFWTKTKETDIKAFWPLEGVEPLKLTQKIHDFANFLIIMAIYWHLLMHLTMHIVVISLSLK